MLKGKKIILGVTGSIAAYKSALLIRLLKKAGAEVKVIMTASALDFITPLTLATLSENPVLTEFKKDQTGEWNNHVELGIWADLLVIAPASANTMAKMAAGLCDNLLLATYLSARCKVMFCPAMDLDMFTHPATVANINTLIHYGNVLIDAEAGSLASGLVGKGRMAEPEHIMEAIELFFTDLPLPLAGKKVLLTAGPTHEYLDPVRYISNGSTGKMGYAIAEELAAQGALVQLVSGPVSISAKHPNIEVISIKTAQQAFEAVKNLHQDADIAIFSAAIADYTPKNPSDRKIKKTGDSLTIEMVKTPDIAAEMGKLKKLHQFHVGFALETHDEFGNARGKLEKKRFDLIVLNSLNDKGAGFGHDTNKVTLMTAHSEETLPLKSKQEVAVDIVQKIIDLFIGLSR